MDAGIRGDGLEIGERLDIAIDIAHAITYLHMYTGMSHRMSSTLYQLEIEFTCIVRY